MSDLIATGTSGYASGSLDTATTLINNVSPHSATHVNGVAAGVIQIETVLGSGTSLKGSMPDLATRLDVSLNDDGTVNPAAISGITAVANGGTSRSTLTQDRVLVGNGTSAVALRTGLIFQGPTSTGSGSEVAHAGSVTISGNQNISGLQLCTNFTLDAGVTLTVTDGAGRLCIFATDTITINGTIDGAGAGSPGGTNDGQSGLDGFTNPGGGGGGGNIGGASVGGTGGNGGNAFFGTVRGGAGTGGDLGTTGGQGIQLNSTLTPIMDPYGIFGGAGGGAGGNGNPVSIGVGGNGGASIILVAPNIILGSASVINTSGANGNSGGATGNGGGGGGSAGNFYVFCITYTDGGCTFTMTAGSGGSGNSGAGAGGAGWPGVKQINLYA